MRRLRIGIVGAGAIAEWAILPALSGPDMLQPPDSGSWWGRRPGPHSDIQYQPAVLPEVVALADADQERAARVAGAARVRAVYNDWRAMVREMRPDALICAADIATTEAVLGAAPAVEAICVFGPPAATGEAAQRLMESPDAHSRRYWMATPLRMASAHRAALRLLERDELGPVTALTLRWGGSLPSGEAPGQFAAGYAAFDLLLALASEKSGGGPTSGGGAKALETVAADRDGSTSVWLRFASGTTATALFAPAENWSSPLPQLEVCGTEARSLRCEGGRRLWLHLPRESARLLEPPGMAAHISSANLLGVAEELKAFLAACVDNRPRHQPKLEAAVRSLQLLETVHRAVRTGQLQKVEFQLACPEKEPPAAGAARGRSRTDKSTVKEVPAATLPLLL